MRKTTLALLFFATTAIANAEMREDVAGIAATVEANYFDPKRATVIANDLRKSAAAGEFDRLADRAELASVLTQRLRKIDGHFSVAWQAEEARPRRLAAAPITPLPESRTNHGFRRVERLPGNIGSIELAYTADIDFARGDSPERRAADTALAMVRNADAVIIDLRKNGGGAPSTVGYLISAFVDAKADVYNTFYSRAGVTSERPAQTYPTPMLAVPLFILTSGRTGSAAESIAFTLQAAKRATVVGERSGGAANPGAGFDTPEGYTVIIATGSPRNPLNGRNWEGEGVKPDVEIDAGAALTRAQQLALEKILAGSISGAARTDAQWALDSLRASMSTSAPTPPKDVVGTYGLYTLVINDGTLQAKRARWPAMTLAPLQTDLYYFDDNPSRRVALERENGKVVAIKIMNSDGSEQHLRKQL